MLSSGRRFPIIGGFYFLGIAMTEYLLLFVGTVLVNNFVLVKFLGLCPFLGVSRSWKAPSAWEWPLPSS